MGHTYVSDPVAGVDTTSITLAYALWEVSRRPDIQQRLHGPCPTPGSLPIFRSYTSCPFSQRWSKGVCPFSFLLPIEPYQLRQYCKFMVLRRTFWNTWYQHLPIRWMTPLTFWAMDCPLVQSSLLRFGPRRDSVVFPSPYKFLLDRWLATHADPSQLSVIHRHLTPFGVGS